MRESDPKNDDINGIWEYKIIKEDKLYKVVEDFGEYGFAETGDEMSTLEELEKMLVDDFFAKIKAIRNYDGNN
jgi:hypothetical protein